MPDPSKWAYVTATLVAGIVVALSWSGQAADLRVIRSAETVSAFIDWSGGYVGLQGSAGAAYGAFDLVAVMNLSSVFLPV